MTPNSAYSHLEPRVRRPQPKTWRAEALSLLPESGNVLDISKWRQTEVERELSLDGTLALEQEELNRWAQLRARELKPTEWLEAHALAEERRQLADPVRVITSGPEVRVPKGEHFLSEAVGGTSRVIGGGKSTTMQQRW